MIADGAKVAADGSVTATFYNVASFPEFNPGDMAEQSGYYFPFKLTGITGTTMTLKKNGVEREDKKSMAFDPEIIVRLTGKTDTLEITVDDKPCITLSFANSTFSAGAAPAMLAAKATQAVRKTTTKRRAAKS